MLVFNPQCGYTVFERDGLRKLGFDGAIQSGSLSRFEWYPFCLDRTGSRGDAGI